MTQKERRLFLIKELLKEHKGLFDAEFPQDEQRQKNLLRSLFNIRMPQTVSSKFIKIQDEYLQDEIRNKGITDIRELSEYGDGLYLWKGDITTLRCDGIVNAANSQMLGCFVPCHGCIDNAIHTFAGVQLRLECAEIMKKQHSEEPVGKAKITKGYNLPCKYIIHTVGPFVAGEICEKDCEKLRDCYNSCLSLAEEQGLKSLAFCCISTGEYHFPNDEAAKIAVSAVKTYKEKNHSEIKVIFNVFKERDFLIYKKLFESC